MSTPFRRLICQVLLLLAMTAPLAAQRAAAAHVVLVTLDGVRPAEFFSGMDSSVSADSTSGAADLARLQRDYWRPTAEARRRTLMPFLWDSLAPRGGGLR